MIQRIQQVHVCDSQTVKAEMRLLDFDEKLLQSPRRLERKVHRERSPFGLQPLE